MALDGKLDEVAAEWDERKSLGVVIAAGGYPIAMVAVMLLNRCLKIRQTCTFFMPALQLKTGNRLLAAGACYV